jgi:hypothetical protein
MSAAEGNAMDGKLHELYVTDFYAWTQQQAALLRAGKLDEAYIIHLENKSPYGAYNNGR